MNAPAHIAFALFLATCYTIVFETSLLITIIIIVFSALLPDIDNRKSSVGKYFWFINWILPHRTLTHSLLGIILWIILFWGVTKITPFSLNPLYLGAFLIGYSSHLLLDALTRKGIYPFWPFPIRIHGRIKNGGVVEHLSTVLFVSLSAGGIFALFLFS
ncbi:MAG: metal-dependent hydrolase [Candidatus Woesearchaeota archaeon]